MDHGSHDKGQRVLAGGQGVALLDDERAAVSVKTVELTDDAECFRVADDLNLRVAQDQFSQGSAVVRLHMVDNDIIQRTARKDVFQILKEQVVDGPVYSIQQNRLLVQQDIGIIGNAPADRVDIFK